MLKAAGGTNNNGYLTALDKGFCDVGDSADIPTPSALSQFRRSISSDFFKDSYKNIISDWDKVRPTWRGLFVQAIDGDQLRLPPSESILKEGFKGYPCPGNKETYYPTMYSCWATDLITGVPVGFAYSHENDEISRGLEILSEYNSPKETLTIFDRFYLSKRLLASYGDLGGYFIARCKVDSTFIEIIQFSKSKKNEIIVSLNGVTCRLIKFKPDNSTEEFIIATNLPTRYKKKDITPLYGYRWESETGNRDRTSSMKIDQFRAKDINGVLQEIYSTLILQAITQIFCANETNPKKYFLKNIYIKANFKAAAIKIVDCIGSLIVNKSNGLYNEIKRLIISSIEKRKRYSRYYDRITKYSVGKLYDHKPLIPRRE